MSLPLTVEQLQVYTVEGIFYRVYRFQLVGLGVDVRRTAESFTNREDYYRAITLEASTRLAEAVRHAIQQNCMGIYWHLVNTRTERGEISLSNIPTQLAQLNSYISDYTASLGSSAIGAGLKKLPERKAMALLAHKIGKTKYKQLKKLGYFTETGKHGEYRFHLEKQGGVTLIQQHQFGEKTRAVEWSLCVQSQDSSLPNGDVILSRWLEWRADENQFLETANFRSVKTNDEAMI